MAGNRVAAAQRTGTGRGRRVLAVAAIVAAAAMLAPVGVQSAAAAESSPAAQDATETATFWWDSGSSKILGSTADDPFSTRLYNFPRNIGATPIQFDGTDGSIDRRFVSELRLDDADGFVYLRLELDQLDFVVDADGVIVGGNVEGQHSTEFWNRDEHSGGYGDFVYRTVTHVGGSYDDGTLSLTLKSQQGETVAELIYTDVPPPSSPPGPPGGPAPPLPRP